LDFARLSVQVPTACACAVAAKATANTIVTAVNRNDCRARSCMVFSFMRDNV
jgi:hypothetical protein